MNPKINEIREIAQTERSLKETSLVYVCMVAWLLTIGWVPGVDNQDRVNSSHLYLYSALNKKDCVKATEQHLFEKLKVCQ